MLSCLSITRPSAPLMLLTNTAGVPGVPPGTGILTTVSLPVLATNSAEPPLLKARPLAPNGGVPGVVRRELLHLSAAPPPCRADFARWPLQECQTYRCH